MLFLMERDFSLKNGHKKNLVLNKALICIWFYFNDFLSSESSVSSSLEASLNSLIPLPRPLISSGIFLPPKRSNIKAIIITHCQTPIIPKITCNVLIIVCIKCTAKLHIKFFTHTAFGTKLYQF